MLQMNQFSHKIIIDEQVLSMLREQSQSNTLSSSFQKSFLDQLDGYLNEHLRGLDFQVKRTVRNCIVETHFKANQAIKLTYYDVAQILLALDLPTKQVISNFQNWILMSTEFTLPYEEVIRVCLQEDFIHAKAWEAALAEELMIEPSEASQEIIVYSEPIEVIEPVEVVVSPSKKAYRIRYGMIALYFITITGLAATGLWYKASVKPVEVSFKDACILITSADDKSRELEVIVKSVVARNSAGYPSYLGFEPINKERLQGYLKRKNSLLADEPYFSTIIEICAVEDVHPALLFAITGQEQGFVKRGSENAALIVNNPFNVYHSWVEYNTNLKDSAKIAAKTVRASLSERPKGENAFKWLNKTYAEDNNWWKGTEDIFMSIEDYIGPYHFENETNLE